MAVIHVHLVRHGRVASHRGDIPLTDRGIQETHEAGRRIGEHIGQDEEIHFLCTPTVRSRETAAALHEAIGAGSGADVALVPTREEWAIRNPDQFVAGMRVEMVSTAEAMAAQIPASGATAADVDAIDYYHHFFRSDDRIGYWIEHPNPPGENPEAVGRRIVSYCASLLDVPSTRTKRYVCVTHSPVLRAVLVEYLDRDPGEPDWVERIDLTLDPSGSSITFRDATAPLPL